MLNPLAVEALRQQFGLPFEANDELLHISLLVPSSFADFQKAENMPKFFVHSVDFLF